MINILITIKVPALSRIPTDKTDPATTGVVQHPKFQLNIVLASYYFIVNKAFKAVAMVYHVISISDQITLSS
jgi:hypothetical protein